MNVDGAWKKKKAAVGIIIRDDQGEIMVALSEQIGRTPDANGAEIMPLLDAVQFALDNDIEDMVLEGDDLHLVNMLKNGILEHSQYRHLIQHLKLLFQTSKCVRTSHVRQDMLQHMYMQNLVGVSVVGK
ncbi:hypothetical protein ACH5RR_030332 [Cinchona calisaya]|uniref:RNase H type-1 domain-containing protein n=1 Tax=Cinchona calisaya TaxID=153742 RepID=A0ABD2YVM7_9GENT